MLTEYIKRIFTYRPVVLSVQEEHHFNGFNLAAKNYLARRSTLSYLVLAINFSNIFIIAGTVESSNLPGYINAILVTSRIIDIILIPTYIIYTTRNTDNIAGYAGVMFGFSIAHLILGMIPFSTYMVGYTEIYVVVNRNLVALLLLPQTIRWVSHSLVVHYRDPIASIFYWMSSVMCVIYTTILVCLAINLDDITKYVSNSDSVLMQFSSILAPSIIMLAANEIFCRISNKTIWMANTTELAILIVDLALLSKVPIINKHLLWFTFNLVTQVITNAQYISDIIYFGNLNDKKEQVNVSVEGAI